ncbi:MAG: hypothetical protein U0414_35890 [Polyangiaceae bacterium]
MVQTFLTIGLVAAGLALVVFARRSLAPAQIFMGRPTTPLRDVRPGPVEVAGRISAHADAAVRSGAGVASVVVHRVVERRVDDKYREESRDTVSVKALLTDATGSCEVSLDHADLMGEVWQCEEGGRRVTEVILPDGAPVLIAGMARREERSDESAYRSGPSPLTVGGSGDAPLLVSIGGERRAVFMYGWRAVLAGVCGVLVIGVAAVVLVLRVAL